MKAFASLLIIFVSVSFVSAEPFVIIVRHAEKAATGGNDPDLTELGNARANVLAQMVKDSGVTAIFTSELKRTIETAAPTAKLLGLTPGVVPAGDTTALVEKL